MVTDEEDSAPGQGNKASLGTCHKRVTVGKLPEALQNANARPQ